MKKIPPSPPGSVGIGHTLQFVRDQFGLIDRGIEEVGDVFRIEVLGVGEIIYCVDPAYIERILSNEHGAFSKEKSVDLPMFTEGLTNVGGAQWSRQHDAMAEHFYPGRIRSYTDEIVSITTKRLDRLPAGDQISLLDQMKTITLENVFGTLFDRRLEPDGSETLRQASRDLHLWFTPTMHLLPDFVPSPTRRRFNRAVERIETEAERLLSERESGELGDDLLSALVEHRRSGSELSDKEIIDQVGSFIFAGHDTTALALTYALVELDDNPDVRARFHDEVDDVVGDSPPGMGLLDELEVTERVLLEAMRMYPPVHAIPRTTTKPVEFGGYRIPADSTVQIPVYNVQNNDRFYTDPDTFRPSRWQERDPQSVGFTYIPFSAGRRACISRRFALLEAKLVLAMIGQRYRIKVLEPVELNPQMTLQPKGPVPAVLEER